MKKALLFLLLVPAFAFAGGDHDRKHRHHREHREKKEQCKPTEKVVYVDRIVYKEKIVYKDRPVEKIVYKQAKCPIPEASKCVPLSDLPATGYDWWDAAINRSILH